MLNFCDFIQVYIFTTNHHLKVCTTTARCDLTEQDPRNRGLLT